MQIISTRRQFIADHSSTNYLFFAAKPLSKESRAVVSKLSSHVDVGSRTAEITYNSEFADLGDDRRKKFLQHFDVELRESYDWWTLSVMLESEMLPDKVKLKDYEVEEEASLTFTKQGKRICLCFDGWHQDYGASYDEFGQDTMEELAELGLKLRAELYAGKTDALRVMQRFILENSDGSAISFNPQSEIHNPQSLLPAPESVHLQLNNICNLRCPSCYVGLHEEDSGGLSLDRIRSLIDEWAGMGVFQLALGGGEPLMSPKFAPVVRYAREHGVAPNVTTNGWLITKELIAEVAGYLGELRLSLNDTVSVNTALLEEKADLLRTGDIRFGYNLIVTRQNLNRLPELLRWACDQGAATINLIRPKPAPGNARWYEHNALRAEDSSRLTELLPELEPLFSKTDLTVDCAFSFLFHGWPAEELQARGVAGCAMGDRFATVKWNGDVFPCSHLHGEEFNAGNVGNQSFGEIWHVSSTFAHVGQRGKQQSPSWLRLQFGSPRLKQPFACACVIADAAELAQRWRQ